MLSTSNRKIFVVFKILRLPYVYVSLKKKRSAGMYVKSFTFLVIGGLTGFDGGGEGIELTGNFHF